MRTITRAATTVDQQAAEHRATAKAGAGRYRTVFEEPGVSGSAERPTSSPAISPKPAWMREAVARIYRPTRSVMQAGRANTKRWVLEFEPRSAPFIEPLMGWTGSADTLQQVRLTFASKERAIAFAERQGWSYAVSEPQESRIQPKSYADNFRSWPAASSATQPQRPDSAGDSLARRRDPRPHDFAPPAAAAQYAGPVHHRKASQAATAANT